MHALRRLIREIHRRSLWQVLGVYAVTSWGALEAVQGITDITGLPGWLPAFALVLLVLGLPVVLATAFVQEGIGGPGRGDEARGGALSPEPPPGRAATDPPGGRPTGVRRLLTWRNALGGGVLALALWGVVAAGWLLFGAREAADSNTGPGEIRSLAVLPLDNLAPDPEAEEYFADGMTEALIAELGQISALKVISRTSVMRYKGTDEPLREIARELGVDGIVEGSVLRAEDRVRITVQLLHAPTDRHLWSESYERDLRDILRLQGEVARAVAREIEARVTPEEDARLGAGRSVDPGALDAYLRGRFHWNKRTEEGLFAAIEEYGRAVEIDPEYAAAHAGLATSYMILPMYSGRVEAREAVERAEAAARRALALDPEVAEGHAALGWVLVQTYRWDDAEAAFRRALEIDPNHAPAHMWYSYFLMLTGRDDGAIRFAERGHELDPHSLIINQAVGRRLVGARRYEDGIRQFRRTLELDPGFTATWRRLGEVLLHVRDWEGARRAFEQWAALDGRDPAWARSFVERVERFHATGEPSGLPPGTDESFLPLPWGRSWHLAMVGELDAALKEMERALEKREPFELTFIGSSPAYDPLRPDPRFRAILREVGLEPTDPAPASAPRPREP